MSKQKPNNPALISHDEKCAAISESSLLVPLAKSKKLAALRKQSQALQSIEKNPVQRGVIAFLGQNKEVRRFPAKNIPTLLAFLSILCLVK